MKEYSVFRVRLCYAVGGFLRRLAYTGTGATLAGVTPRTLSGWRARILHLGVAIEWLASHPALAIAHVRYAVTGHFHPRSVGGAS